MVREEDGGADTTSNGSKSDRSKPSLAYLRGVVTPGEPCGPYSRTGNP